MKVKKVKHADFNKNYIMIIVIKIKTFFYYCSFICTSIIITLITSTQDITQ